jgi:hypothetical protein
MMMPLMTSRNKPSVTIVTGSVSTIRIGFTIASIKPNNKATNIAVKILSMDIPGRIYASTKALTVVMRMRNKNFIALLYTKFGVPAWNGNHFRIKG